MKRKLIIALAVASLLAGGQSIFAQDGDPAFTKELTAVTTKVQAKMKAAPKTDDGKAGKLTAADLADELKAIDELITKNKTSKPENAVRALQLKSSVYASAMGDRETYAKLQAQIKTDYPEVLKKQQEQAAERRAAAEKAQAALAVGNKFPDFNEKDLNGKPLSVANYKGKVVLVDFWATWCGPCVAELPNVQAAYEKHHAKGFEIIGISLDSDRAKLEKFIKDKNMPWAQYFDGQGWKNKVSTSYGVNSIPATYLIDGEGKIIGKNLRGEKLEEAVAKALNKG